MNNLKICVVGLGAMGRLHILKLAKMKNLALYGVDSDKEKIKELKKSFNIPLFHKIDDVLDKIDAAIISTPTSTHYPLGKRLLKRGVHLFIEKPLAENVRDAEKLCKIAEQNGSILQVGHIERFNPSFCRLKKLINRPYMLAFYRLSPFPGRSMDVDVVMDLMIHDIDLLLNLIRSNVKKVEAYGYRFVSKKPDVVTTKIILDQGCVVNLVSNRVYSHKVRKIFVFERGKYILSDLLNFKVLTVTPGGNKTVEREEKIEPYDMIEAELQSFIQSIRNKTTPVVSGKDGVKAIKLAEQIQQRMQIF